MKPTRMISSATLAILLMTAPGTNAGSDAPETLAEQLCATYSQIQSVSCEIRKTTKGSGRTMRMLSRIHYRAPNRVHVDNVSPIKRTIIADGERLYYHESGVPRGFSRPIEDLSDTWMAPLRNIPGTAVEHLLPLCGLSEIALQPSDENAARRGYQAKDVYVVLTADAEKRLHRIDFFKSAAMKAKTGEYTFTHFQEVMPGCWVPTQHKATLFLPADEVVVETRRISNLAVNGNIPDHLFNADLFFKDVEFVDDFQKTYR
jgi:outer membrane lipoprotein-sorting protein